jgi:CHAT domain-containing protein
LPKAEELYRGALAQARREGDRSWTAEFLRRLGELRERQHDLKGALEWYEQSLPIRRELGQKPETARLLLGTGLVKLNLGDLAGGAERVDAARALYHELGDPINEAQAAELLAQVNAARGEFEKAEGQLREALAIYQERRLPGGIVAVHTESADLFFKRSLYHGALSEGFAAIDAADAARKDMPDGDDRRTMRTNQANAMDIVANTYQKMVQLPRALDYYQQALAIRRELHDDESAAFTESNMAPVLIELHRTPEAVASLQQALEVRRAIGNKANIASTLMALGEADLAEEKPVEARKQYEEALTLAPEGSSGQAVALYQLGNLSLEAGELDQALAFHQRALDIRGKLRNPHDVVRSRIQMAAVQEARGKLTDAAESYVQAADGFEKLLAEVSDPVQLASFRETAGRLYPNYARLLFRQAKPGEALLAAERGRGQALARMTGARQRGFLELLTPPQRTRWDNAAAALAKAANRFRIALEQQAPSQQQAEANAAWVEAKLELTRTRERIAAENPQLQSQEPPAPIELQSLLDLSRRDPSTIYLEWLAMDNRSTLLFSLSSGDVHAYLLPAGITALHDLVGNWRNSLIRDQGRGFPNAPVQPYSGKPEPDLARAVYSAALGPLGPFLESGTWRRLVAVPDGPLLDAPLSALITAKGKRLVESFSIATATSLHSLAVKAANRSAQSSLLAIGDPSEKGKDRVVIPSGAHLQPLAQARTEAKAIAAEFPGTHPLVGPEAREGAVKRRLDCCTILHFATHGLLDSEDGMDSGLLLAAEPADSNQDGVLQAWEIADMRLNAKLAVLSACDSARGDQTLGEGLVGLAWAFQAAGTPAVVASLWSVDDAATAGLMRTFYASLQKGARVDDAMRQAMLRLHGQHATSSPYYWAAFSLVGSAEPIQ